MPRRKSDLKAHRGTIRILGQATRIHRSPGTRGASSSAQWLAGSSGTLCAVKEIRDGFGVSRKVFARLTSFSERAIAGWEGGAAISPPIRQKMVEMKRLRESLGKIVKSDYIPQWLETPNPAFGGFKPLEVIERGEIDRIWRMVFELQSGAPG